MLTEAEADFMHMAYNILPLRWSKREEGVERLRDERKLAVANSRWACPTKSLIPKLDPGAAL